ncbi:MAG: pilus assembly protein [Alphaproteobacteria bacterium]|nr:pilus assembly protein [Alphaproteobacteria bacterium]
MCRLRRRLAAFGFGSSSGVTAVEFAMITPVFLILVFGVFEVGIIFLAQSTLQNAVSQSARLIRTGQAQSGNLSASDFRARICGNFTSLLSCGAELQVDVQNFANFSTASYANPLNPDGTINTNLQNYSPGGSAQIVLVRATYSWPVMTPLLTPFLVNMANNSHLLVASAAFRNEPY